VHEHTNRILYGNVKTFNVYTNVMYELHADWKLNAFVRIRETQFKPLPVIDYEGKDNDAIKQNEIEQLRMEFQSFKPCDDITDETNVKVFIPYLQVAEWLKHIGQRAATRGGVHCKHFLKVLDKNEEICRTMLRGVVDKAMQQPTMIIKQDRVQVLDTLLEEHCTATATIEMIGIKTQMERLQKDYVAKGKEIKRKSKLESLIKHVKTIEWETDEELISTCFDLSEHLKKRIKF
jgi:hypothetical protein